MTKLLFLGCCIFQQLTSLAFSRTDSTPALDMCRTVEIALYDDFILSGRSLPTSFEDMPSLREIAEHQWTDSPHQFDLLNALVLVPNAPAIKKEMGVSSNRSGSRLFAISRTWNFDYARGDFDKSDPMAGGRFAILISENPLSVASNWISEQESRLILNQINDFDPAKQPQSFEDFAKNARVKAKEKGAHIKNMRKIWGDSTRQSLRERDGFSKISENKGILWPIGAFIVVMLLALLAIRRRIKLKAGA